eukprot:5891508-Pyramimonas_sp.AAC.1
MIQYGWSGARGTLVNKSCGVKIWLNKRRFRRSQLVQFWAVPTALQGRLGVVRVRSSQHDFTFVVSYYPPGCTDAKSISKYDVTIRKLTEELHLISNGPPNRSTTIAATDLNDGMGLQYSDGFMQSVDSTSLGPYGRSQEHQADALNRDWMETNALTSVT